MALNREQLQAKLGTVASELLKEKGYISFVDVFMRLDYLDAGDYENWRMKRVQYLERVIKTNLGKISFIMKTVRQNCLNGNFNQSRTAYKSWGKGKKIDLIFSKTGDPNIEKLYATHFVQKNRL